MYNDAKEVIENGLFQGYDTVVVLIVLIQAFGGLMVAVAVKYADNILKVFATSISIIVSSIFSYLVLDDLTAGTLFFIGTVLVLTSTVLYGKFAKQGGSSPTQTPSKMKRKSSPVAEY